MFQRVISEHMQAPASKCAIPEKPIFQKVVWHRLEIPRQKTNTDGNSTLFFLDHCWKFHFFFNWPLEFPHALSLMPMGNSMS